MSIGYYTKMYYILLHGIKQILINSTIISAYQFLMQDIMNDRLILTLSRKLTVKNKNYINYLFHFLTTIQPNSFLKQNIPTS